MADLRPRRSMCRPLRREALFPLPSAMRFPFLLVIGTVVVLIAAATDAVVWTQGSERRALQRQVHDTQVEAELLRLENDRLRRELFHQKVMASEAAPCEGTDLAPVVVECAPEDPLCGL